MLILGIVMIVVCTVGWTLTWLALVEYFQERRHQRRLDSIYGRGVGSNTTGRDA